MEKGLRISTVPEGWNVSTEKLFNSHLFPNAIAMLQRTTSS